jgi:peptide/nickel transport system permease protein
MRFFIRRLGFYLATLWAALTINFLIPRMMPGNPVQSLVSHYQGQGAEAAVTGLEQTFGLNSNEGLLGQYWHYLEQLAHGNLGLSITYYPSTVSSVISHSLPWTIGLVGISTVISFLLGTWAGILAGWRRGSRISDVMVPVGTFMSSMPYFWIGLLALTVFGVTLHWFPLAGGTNPDVAEGWNGPFLSSVLTHAVLPAATIIVSSVGGWLLTMRNMTVTTMSEDYITVAVAKGLPPRRIMYQYAARNALLPNLSSFALSLGFIVSGSIVTETVFSYPGIGFELFNAVANDDYPLMQGIFLVITLTVLVANLLADVFYLALDPRIRLAGPR